MKSSSHALPARPSMLKSAVAGVVAAILGIASVVVILSVMVLLVKP